MIVLVPMAGGCETNVSPINSSTAARLPAAFGWITSSVSATPNFRP